MPTYQTRTDTRKGFTLVEILVVLTIIGVLASVMIPRISFWFEPSSAVLQRAFEEAGNLALSGTPIRLSIRTGGTSKRGVIAAEAFRQKEESADSLSAFLGTNSNRPIVFEWQNLEMKNLPEDEGWKFEPEVIYFYADGSCTPARITQAGKNSVYDRDAEEYVLTVTGYCVKIEK